MNPKRVALWFLIISVALSAVVGIIAIVAGTFGRTEAQILLTTLTISGASILALACGALWETGRAKTLPLTGIVLAVSDAGLFIVGIWFESQSERYWQFSASAGLIAVATAHACLLSLARLAPRFVWSKIAAIVTAYSLALLFIYLIYYTPKGDTIIRVIGVMSIILAALTILIPVFHRLSRGDLDAASAANDVSNRLSPMIMCPRCGTSLPNSLTETKCGDCGCTFLITIVDNSAASQPQAIS